MTLSCRAGNFTKKTDGTGTQSITGLGFQPELIIFFSMGKSADGTWSSAIVGTIGATTGASNSKAVGCASDGGPATRNVSSRNASKAIAFVQFGEVTLAEADLDSFDSDGFTLNWTTNEATAVIVHYLAFRGVDIQNSNIVEWSTGTAVTTVGVTGVGFTPDLVLHLFAGTGTDTGPTPASGPGMEFGMGCMDGTNEWSVSGVMWDGFTTDREKRFSGASDTIASAHGAPGFDAIRAAFSSFDADGFTVNVTTAPSSSMQVMSLCLKGLTSFIGVHTKGTGTGPDAVSGVGFQPVGLFVAGAGQISDGRLDDGSFSIGATDGTREEASAFSSDQSAANCTVSGVDSTSKVYISDEEGSQLSNAEADFTSFDSDGFTLDWATNEAQADRIHYLAFGSVPLPDGEQVAAMQTATTPDFSQDFVPVGY